MTIYSSHTHTNRQIIFDLALEDRQYFHYSAMGILPWSWLFFLSKTTIQVLFAMVASASTQTAAEVCPRAVRKEFSDPVVNQTLIGPLLHSAKQPDEMFCQLQCHVVDECFMYNYNESSGLCELLHGSAADLKITKTPGSLFRTQKCISNPCQNGHACVMLGSNQTCLCTYPWKGSFCEINVYTKLNSGPVCFGARGNSFGRFYMGSQNAMVRTFKFVHLSGGVSFLSSSQGKWGTQIPFWENKNIEVHITDSQKRRIFPTSDIPIRPDFGSQHYRLPGRTNMDPELILPDFNPPLAVTAGQELQMWFGQDLLDWGESDNTGTSCCDVFAYYDD